MADQQATPVILSIDDPKRLDIARRAGCQIEAVAAVLRDVALGDAGGLEDLVLALAVRLGQLSSVVMSASGDNSATVSDMENLLFGSSPSVVGREVCYG